MHINTNNSINMFHNKKISYVITDGLDNTIVNIDTRDNMSDNENIVKNEDLMASSADIYTMLK